MDSRIFIKEASALINDISQHKLLSITRSREQLGSESAAIQKRLNLLFSKMHNESLPSAYKLRNAAFSAGFAVDHKVNNRINQADTYW